MLEGGGGRGPEIMGGDKMRNERKKMKSKAMEGFDGRDKMLDARVQW